MMKPVQPKSNSIIRNGSKICLNIKGKQYYLDTNSPILGKGAMGVVFRGVESNTGKPVAIKRVNPKYANNPDIRRRARQEAKLEFDHPNLVQMLGCCEEAPNKGDIFIVSRMVSGQNIDQFINTNIRSMPQPERRICELFMPVLDALGYLHEKSILHLDIKPSNIMMEKGKNVRLMDLGIADITVATDNNPTLSSVMGTPRYAAPEQFGNNKDNNEGSLSKATDIYEAGVTLYELITQKNPFKAPTIIEIMKQHNTKSLEPTNSISAPVLKVLQKATAINPQERYQTVWEMKEALKNALITKPDPWLKRYWWIIAIVISLIAILGLVLVYTIFN